MNSGNLVGEQLGRGQFERHGHGWLILGLRRCLVVRHRAPPCPRPAPPPVSFRARLCLRARQTLSWYAFPRFAEAPSLSRTCVVAHHAPHSSRESQEPLGFASGGGAQAPGWKKTLCLAHPRSPSSAPSAEQTSRAASSGGRSLPLDPPHSARFSGRRDDGDGMATQRPAREPRQPNPQFTPGSLALQYCGSSLGRASSVPPRQYALRPVSGRGARAPRWWGLKPGVWPALRASRAPHPAQVTPDPCAPAVRRTPYSGRLLGSMCVEVFPNAWPRREATFASHHRSHQPPKPQHWVCTMGWAQFCAASAENWAQPPWDPYAAQPHAPLSSPESQESLRLRLAPTRCDGCGRGGGRGRRRLTGCGRASGA